MNQLVNFCSRAISVFMLILILAGAAFADQSYSKIDAYLQGVLNSTEDGEFINAYLVMKDRLSYEDLKNQTRGLAKEDRRKEVVRILKNHAAQTQTSVRAFLESAKSQNMVENITIIWAINVISFRATPAVITDLASGYSEIEKIFFDPQHPVEELIDDNGITRRNEKYGLSVGPMYSPQPGLTLINAPQVWAEGDSGQGVIVANIDTGTDWTHPDLANNIWNNLGEDADGDGRTMEFTGSTWTFDPGDINNIDDDSNGHVDDFIGWNYSGNNNDPSSGSSHGTATSGIVAGDGTNGTETGVAPRAKLIILKPSGESQVWAAQQYAIDKGADVVTSSLSYKWYFTPQPNYPMWREMTDMELAAGIVHSNSTSNDGNNLGSAPIPYNISAPGNCPPSWIHPDQTLVGGVSSVIGVGNVHAVTDVIASSSPHGPAAWEDIQSVHPSYPYAMPPQYQDYPFETIPGEMGLLKPDVTSPGNGTISTAPGGGYQSFSGTSGATPHVAGTAALVLAANPDLEPADVSRIIQTTGVEKGTPGKDNRYGAGRIDAYQAYRQAIAEAGQPNPPTEFDAYSDYTTPNSMLLSWTDPTHLLNGDTLEAGAFHVLIQRDSVLIDSVPGGTEQYTDLGLTDGQLYTYQILAKVDSSGKVSEMRFASWTAGGSPVPNPPVSFSVAGTQDEITITWENPTDNIDFTPMDDFAGINLYRNGTLAASFTRTSADTGRADTAVHVVSTPGYYDWHITAFDNETPPNESDSTIKLGTPLNIPITDQFENAGPPNPGIWINTNGVIDDRSVNPPSGPYALNLNGTPAGGDTVDMKPLDLSGMQGTGVELSYYFQPQGNGNAPEPGDSLQVYFKNDLDEWILVTGHQGSAVQPFQQQNIEIESAPSGSGSYFHGQFQVRFRSIGGAANIPNDDWFVDDVRLGLPVGIAEGDNLPKVFSVSQNYPNPFNPSTRIEYQLPKQSDVKLVIYNMLGQKVRTLINQTKTAGAHEAVWDGRNDRGISVSSGIYFYRFEAGDYRNVQKMILMK